MELSEKNIWFHEIVQKYLCLGNIIIILILIIGLCSIIGVSCWWTWRSSCKLFPQKDQCDDVRAMSAALIRNNFTYWHRCLVFLILFLLSQLFWLIGKDAPAPPYIPSQHLFLIRATSSSQSYLTNHRGVACKPCYVNHRSPSCSHLSQKSQTRPQPTPRI